MGRFFLETAVGLLVLLIPATFAWAGDAGGLHREVGAVVALVGAALASEAWARLVARSVTGAVRGPDPGTLGWVVAAEIALVHAAVAPAPENFERAFGGACLLVLGLATRWMAVLSLGSRFAGPPVDDAPLHTEGIYSQMRHPAAASGVMLAGGAALVLGSGFALLWALFVQIPLAIWEARREDRALAERHGDDFAAYREKTPSLVPTPRRI